MTPLRKKLCCERTSQSTCLFTFSVVVVDLPIDCILSFLFPAETDVLVPVLSQSTDVVVVNFVVVLKFPNSGAPRAREAPLLSKSTHSRKFGNHVTVHRPPTVRPHHRKTNVYSHILASLGAQEKTNFTSML